MSYNTIARAAHDGDLQQRLMAAAASEGHPDPQGFVLRNTWRIAANPSVADPYQPLVQADLAPQEPPA